MKTIVTQIGEGIRNYPVVKDWVRFFGDDPDSPEFNIRSFFPGDPDILRCDGHKQYFVSVDKNKIRYVLTRYEVTDTEREMLQHFFSDDFQEHFTEGEQTWDHFHQSDRGIAYRGGYGYAYTIWDYNH